MTSPQITEISLAAIISKEDAERLTADFDSDDTSAMTDLLLDWAKYKKKFSYLNGKIAGYVTETDKGRLAVRNYIRQLMGLNPLTDELQPARESSLAGQVFESGNAETEFGF